MKTLIESNIEKQEGSVPFSISLNDTEEKLFPYSTHLKTYEGEEHFFYSGDYCSTLKQALASFKERCEERGLQY